MEKYYLDRKVYITSNENYEECIVLDTNLEEYYAVDGLYAVILNLCKTWTTFDDVITFIGRNYEIVDEEEIKSVIYECMNRGWLKCS